MINIRMNTWAQHLVLADFWNAERLLVSAYYTDRIPAPSNFKNVFFLLKAGTGSEIKNVNLSHKFMSTSTPSKITVFFVLSLVILAGLIISSMVMINQQGMNSRLQGWVNLLWLPLPLLILIVDRICVRKFGAKSVNKIQLYIVAILILLFIINLLRLNA